jgi:hypothetical protein
MKNLPHKIDRSISLMGQVARITRRILILIYRYYRLSIELSIVSALCAFTR